MNKLLLSVLCALLWQPASLAQVTPVAPPVVSPVVTLAGAYLGQASSINKMNVGDVVPFQAWAVLSLGVPLQIAGSSIGWSSSDPSVLIVDGNGLVTAIGVGKADVQAMVGPVKSSPWTVNTTMPVTYPVSQTLAPGIYAVVVSPTGAVTITKQ